MSDTPKKDPRTVPVMVRLTPKGADAIDRARGNWTRPQWLREAARIAHSQGLRGPQGPVA